MLVWNIKRRAQFCRYQLKEASLPFPKEAGVLQQKKREPFSFRKNRGRSPEAAAGPCVRQKKRGPSSVANQSVCGGAKGILEEPKYSRGHQRAGGGTKAPVEAPEYLWRNQSTCGGANALVEEPKVLLEEPKVLVKEPAYL